MVGKVWKRLLLRSVNTKRNFWSGYSKEKDDFKFSLVVELHSILP